nr:MAG TPA: ParB protein [Caudoviricetes sp.]
MKELKWEPIKNIRPYEKNPRRNDEAVDAVAASIREFGWQQPIVVDWDGVIIAGHTRYKAAKKLKCDTVPVVVADDLTEDQVKAYRLADNKTGEFAGWDFAMLQDELAQFDDFDMEQFGFDDDAKYAGIEELLNNDEAMGKGRGVDKTEFDVTFSFPKKHELFVMQYIRENGKSGLVDMILHETGAI